MNMQSVKRGLLWLYSLLLLPLFLLFLFVPADIHCEASESGYDESVVSAAIIDDPDIAGDGQNVQLENPELPQQVQAGSPELPQQVQAGSPELLQQVQAESPELPQQAQTGSPELPQQAQTGNPEPPQGEQTGSPEQIQKAQIESPELQQQVDKVLTALTTEEKVAQLFIITPEALTGVQNVTMAGPTTEAAFSEYPVGGILYMENNIQSMEQISQMLDSMQRISLNRVGVPAFLSVDEEGGNVRRVSGRIGNIPYISDMYSVGSTGDPLQAYEVGVEIGNYLRQIGFNVDLAPVADVLTNSGNTVIGTRSFGSDPIMAAKMVSMEVTGLKEEGVCATLKHFPGHGNTFEDSHQGTAVSNKSLEELEECELIPFREGIEAGAQFVMVGHISLPNVIGDNTPSSLSHVMMTDILRNKLGFSGIILTDALNMGAIVNTYGAGEASVKAFLAGADMILAPGDFQTAFYSMLEAVNDGRISQERLTESLRRIVGLKIQMQEPTDLSGDQKQSGLQGYQEQSGLQGYQEQSGLQGYQEQVKLQ